MASKKNFHNFMLDGDKDEKLRKGMVRVVKRKTINAEMLLSEFRRRHYEGVTITDCRKILKTLEDPAALQKLQEWAY